MIKQQNRQFFNQSSTDERDVNLKDARPNRGRFPLIWSPLLVVFFLSGLFISPTSKAITDLGNAERLRLEKGDVVINVQPKSDHTKGMVEATILIKAPVENIWRVMVDCAQVPSYVPGVNACRVISEGKNWEIIEHDVSWSWFFPNITYSFRAEYIQNSRIDFVRTGGDLKDMMGHWSLNPIAGDTQTMVCYSVYIDPGFFIPQWLVRHSLKKDLPAVLRALRNRVINAIDEPKKLSP